jgi:hypothetical protein
VSNKVTLITYPDYVHNQSKKVLLINSTAEERIEINNWLLKNDIEITIYFYNNDEQVAWLLNVANQSDSVYINIDNSTDISYYYTSYLVSKTNTVWNSQTIDYSILNRGRVRNINEYIEKHWLDQRQ